MLFSKEGYYFILLIITEGSTGATYCQLKGSYNLSEK